MVVAQKAAVSLPPFHFPQWKCTYGWISSTREVVLKKSSSTVLVCNITDCGELQQGQALVHSQTQGVKAGKGGGILKWGQGAF